MKGKCSLFSHNSDYASGNISFMGNIEDYSKFAKYIANRSDVDPNGMLDIIAHGNSDLIEVVSKGKIYRIKARDAAKLIKSKDGFKKCKSIRLFSCSTGATENGFAQNLANALGKPVYAPNMTIHSYSNGLYWIADNGKKGKFVEFVPGGNKNGR